MYPSIEEAQTILKESAILNPGPWEHHSYLVAECAKKIATECGMDAAKAYVLGLLHDVGRRFGISHLKHVYEGYQYMNQQGFDEVARVCLTHSFHNQTMEDYIGNFDISQEECNELQQILSQITYDDYDKLVQLCDCMATGEAIVDIDERITDVKTRYGAFPECKRKKIKALRKYFEQRMKKDIYSVVM